VKRTLMQTLFAEVGQTERSAIRHPRVEARRLGECPPAAALLNVTTHAERAKPALESLAGERGATRTAVGAMVGSLFSIGRNGLADFFLTAEQSYRGTLLGMRHGYDVVTLFRLAALAEGDAPVVAWTDAWLSEREPLLRNVADQMRWFVAHPERALQNAKELAKVGTRTTAPRPL
jgi:hypothetical protein